MVCPSLTFCTISHNTMINVFAKMVICKAKASFVKQRKMGALGTTNSFYKNTLTKLRWSESVSSSVCNNRLVFTSIMLSPA